VSASSIAFYLCVLFVFWLLHKERRLWQRTSAAVWLPLIWLLILGSRPVSTWRGGGAAFLTTEEYLDGSPLDRVVFFGLIIAGLVVLARRQANWQEIIAKNRWLFALFFLLGVSAIWSDYPFVSFKRWIKDFGNVIMALVLLSEADPVAAVKSVFLRTAYVLIPFSLVFCRYFADIGRSYNRWTGEVSYCGVTTNKNELGMTLAVCAIILIQRLQEVFRRKRPGDRAGRDSPVGPVLIGLMGGWLLHMAHSSTCLASVLMATAILVGSRIPAFRKRLKMIWVYAFTLMLTMFILQSVFNVESLFVTALGRDLTFTGRTDIWQMVLSEKINPLLGVGFYTFWLGPRADRLAEKFWFHPNEAHNGYLETYLNNGILGLILLVGLLITAGRRLKDDAVRGGDFGVIRLSIFIITLFYNMTESVFDRLSPIWFAFLVAVIEYPRRRARKTAPAPPVETLEIEGQKTTESLR
jgi:exopolysaccharide production protein ExoQ